MNSTDIRTAAAIKAQALGYRVHHDICGWYILNPREREPASGYSLGFDRRKHFANDDCEAAWEHACRCAERVIGRRRTA